MELTFGLHNNQLVHVSQVERGLKCGCICPACNHLLVARKGKKKQHHFAHHKGSECNLETAIHYAAKQIIKDAGEIYIPDTNVVFDSYRKAIPISEGEVMCLEDLKDEAYLGNITPDIIGYYKGKPLLIEIYVTHESDNEKINKLKSRKLSAIEIDLSCIDYNTDIETLKQFVLYNKKNRKWLNNHKANVLRTKFLATCDVIKPTLRSMAIHADDCPMAVRVWKGKPYANVIDDCLGCEYCFDLGQNMNTIFCAGRKKITTMEKLLHYTSMQ